MNKEELLSKKLHFTMESLRRFVKENEELMWHVFENKQSIDAGADEEEKIIPMLKRYLNDNRRAV